jgi:serine/threonine protein kinase
VIYDCGLKFDSRFKKQNSPDIGVDEGFSVLSAVKMCDKAPSIYDRSVVHDIFSEISCLEYFRLQQSLVTLYDFGFCAEKDQYFIVMEKFPMSLKKWRSIQQKSLEHMIGTYLCIFREVNSALNNLHLNNVTHYDIKCDNILLDPDNQTPENGKLGPKFRIAIADLGTCKIFVDEDEEVDVVSRGTMCIKSPEMLNLDIANNDEGAHFDRRRKVGTTRASDIWSMGCLLFELLTNKFLFNDSDWLKFYSRLTNPKLDILESADKNAIGLNSERNGLRTIAQKVVELLENTLIRNPDLRPTASHMGRMFE